MQKKLKVQSTTKGALVAQLWIQERVQGVSESPRIRALFDKAKDERGDVPGWVLVVLMTTGLVTAIWTIAAPRLSAILKNSLDAMNGIR
ncbi:MAG: hypothetical protein ACKOPU_04685 [Candidatus Planktophila sp.]